jgi:hypothetical protein
MYLRIYSHSLLQIYLQNGRKTLIYHCGTFRNKLYSANKFAVTGANEFANTLKINQFNYR